MSAVTVFAIYIAGVALLSFWLRREVSEPGPADLVALIMLWPIAAIGLCLMLLGDAVDRWLGRAA